MTNDELYHFGILGQKWGIRRYQNEDGTLTEEGRRHYAKTLKKLEKNYYDAKSQEQFNYSKYDRTGNEKYYKKAENATKVAQMLESNTWKAIGNAIQDGYNVDIEQGSRLNKVVVDRSAIAGFAFGLPTGVVTGLYNLAVYPETRDFVPSNKYKVRKSTNQQGKLTQHTRNKPYI